MTDAEKVSTLRGAIERADKALDWILAQPDYCPESTMTTASRVRRILQAALRKTEDKPSKNQAKITLPEVRLDLAAMKANGILKEAKRK